MAEILKGLASGDDLKTLAPARAKSVDEKTIAAGSADSLALKLAAEEADGWRELKRNKRSIRVCRDKPVDRQLEDDVWSMLYRMGFSELNASRDFKIQLSERAPARQLDVFAKDHDTVFIVECTHSRDTGSKSVKALIDKIGAIREEVIKAVHHYGNNPKLNIKFATATRNIDWRAADRTRANDAGIALITEDDIAYFPSKDGYAPLAQFWAERGIAVIQPTHASSRVGSLDPNLPDGPFFWRERVVEMRAILDQLGHIERQAPAIADRLDHDRIAVAGHSFGGHTCSLLLGGRLQGEDFSDPRIRAGILLATPGRGGADLTPEHATRFPFFDVDFSGIDVPILVVSGAKDDPHFTPRGPEWHADAFHDAPGANALLTISGVGHGLGGIVGFDARETEVEDPDALEATRRLTLAWLSSKLSIEPDAWTQSQAALRDRADAIAKITEKKLRQGRVSEAPGTSA
jgi:predicted dienelactone hydrolase